MPTFKIDDVKPYCGAVMETAEARQHVQTRYHCYDYKNRVEYDTQIVHAASKKDLVIEMQGNPFLAAMATAHNEHLPLSISPDSVWLCIAQGFATHVLENAEALRHHFVEHEGKEKLVVDLPHSDAEQMDWTGALGWFSQEISKRIGKKRDLFVSDFSTTGEDERVASEVVMMKTMSEYFSYGARTLCGFPLITLEGTVADWVSVRDRFRVFSEFEATSEGGIVIPLEGGLKWWSDALMPVLDQLVATAEGKIDVEFWRSAYKNGGGSGGPFVNGWVNTLFPFLPNPRKGNMRNPYVITLSETGRMPNQGPGYSDFPEGLVSVDCEWNDLGLKRDLQFHGGLLGISQADDLTMRAECGWAVSELIEEPLGSKTNVPFQ